ncbi:hypothetical protein [Sanguibacter sp. HDW7]|uniref:hypothetical protein n=1 Tax=Sanguibacter sp. HDW7 TaxID=2714931 RepID=UPI00140E5A2A|nr:hypothetical protein [Sanguibacter sp. HDW7]QIK83772.1 hypothetical protein G7063_09135 [Sanguibacter sp. HDW7]
MTAAVVLALVVTADVARGARLPRRALALLVALAVAAVGVTLVVGLGAHVVTVVVGALVAGAWATLMPHAGSVDDGVPAAPPRAWPAAALAAVLVVAALVPGPVPAGPLVDAWARTVPGREGVPVAVALAVVVVLVGLTRTANIVTRAALARARRLPDGDAAALPDGDAAPLQAFRRPTGWRLTVRGRDLASVSAVEAQPVPGPVMRGGRYIGPLERVLVLVLALAGAFPVIAAVLAAKGVVRFPEISADRARGTKAEEFLVGSLVSWACAGAGVLLVRVCGLG